jgi:hypothetical protein
LVRVSTASTTFWTSAALALAALAILTSAPYPLLSPLSLSSLFLPSSLL